MVNYITYIYLRETLFTGVMFPTVRLCTQEIHLCTGRNYLTYHPSLGFLSIAVATLTNIFSKELWFYHTTTNIQGSIYISELLSLSNQFGSVE